MAYYKQIEGVQCDKAIIDACAKAVAGRGDGRVSLEDAHQVFEKIKDAGKVTKNEVWTLRYCLTEYNFTQAAADWITEETKKMTHWNPEKFAKEGGHAKGYYEQVDGQECDHGIIEACRKAVAGAGDGRVSKDDAKLVLAEALDGGKVTDKEKWTLRLCLSEFNWTEAAHDHLVDELKAAGVAMKRPASSAAAKPAKKAKVVDETPAKCKTIVAALKTAQKKGVPAEVTELLSGMLVHALPTFKEERHAFQKEVLDMTTKTLADAQAALEEDVASAQGLVSGGDEEKAKREAAVTATEAAYTAAQEDTKAKEAAKKEKADAYKATVDPLKQAQKAQKEGDAGADALDKEKASLEQSLTDLPAMKESGANKRQLAKITKALNEAGLEDSLVECIHLPFGKKPEARGSFDGVVLQKLDEAIEQKFGVLNAAIAQAAPDKEARAAVVKGAQDAHDAAKTASEAAAEALVAAKQAEADAKKAAEDAKKSAANLGSELLTAAKTLDKAKEALESFKTGALANFTELQERSAPPPEAEAAPEA